MLVEIDVYNSLTLTERTVARKFFQFTIISESHLKRIYVPKRASRQNGAARAMMIMALGTTTVPDMIAAIPTAA